MARHEASSQARVDPVAADALAELTAGAGQESALDVSSDVSVLHRLLAVQTALLEKTLASRPSDSVTAALATGGSENTAGVRGYAAREAFLRQLAQHGDVAAAVSANAARELGLSPSEVASNLMLEFVKRKIPLGDHRQLSYMATLFAHAWQSGHTSGNVPLQAWASRGLMFCEQVALDGGRCQLGWMLTGLQPPDFHLLSQHRRRAHVQPFATLAKPTWAAACISYLKEMSYLEGRVTGLQTPAASSNAAREEEADAPAPRRPPRRPKPKAKPQDSPAQ